DHHINGDAPDKSGQRVLDPEDQLAFLLRRHGPVGDFTDATADEVHAFFQQLVVELLVALAGSAHVDVEVEYLGLGMLLEQMRQLQGIHAADARAPAVGLLIARPDAMDDADGFRMPAVAEDHITARWTRGVDEALDLQGGIDVREGAIAVLRNALGIKGLEPGGYNNRADLDFLDLLRLLEVNGLLLSASLDAGLLALVGERPALKVKADLRIDQHNLGCGLREGDIDRFALAKALVEFVQELRLLINAVGDALLAAGAEVLIDVAGLPPDCHRKVADVAVHL